MRLAEYVLVEDRRLDLADLTTARDWLFSRDWYGTEDSKGLPLAFYWTAQAQEQWPINIDALRSLAWRLLRTRKGQLKARRPVDGFSPWRADTILGQHLGLMRLKVERPRPSMTTRRARKPQPLSAATLDLMQWPTKAPESGSSGDRIKVQPWPENFCEDNWQVFWQCVFYSLVLKGHFPVCSECGVALRGRQSVCRSCSYRRWERDQSRASLRKKWRETKAENRALNRPLKADHAAIRGR
jgi:hypothetical protein